MWTALSSGRTPFDSWALNLTGSGSWLLRGKEWGALWITIRFWRFRLYKPTIYRNRLILRQRASFSEKHVENAWKCCLHFRQDRYRQGWWLPIQKAWARLWQWIHWWGTWWVFHNFRFSAMAQSLIELGWAVWFVEIHGGRTATRHIIQAKTTPAHNPSSYIWLVLLTILKNMSSSMGRIRLSHIWWKIIQPCSKHFQTTNQIYLSICLSIYLSIYTPRLFNIAMENHNF